MDQDVSASDLGAAALPDNVWGYIEDTLSELAGLACANGAYTLATTITIAALEAARTSGQLKP